MNDTASAADGRNSLIKRSFDLTSVTGQHSFGAAPTSHSRFAGLLTNHASGSRVPGESFLGPIRSQGATSSKISPRAKPMDVANRLPAARETVRRAQQRATSWRCLNRRGLALAPYRFGLAVIRRTPPLRRDRP
jgi:hypothetical protein